MDRTLILIKPDAFARNLTGEIIARFERKGLRIAALRQMTVERELAERHYAEHVGKGFYADLVTFMGRSPAFVAVVEGPDDVFAIVRTMMGPTNPAAAPPGTLRGDFGTQVTENLVHGSDSNESAARETQIFFPELG